MWPPCRSSSGETVRSGMSVAQRSERGARVAGVDKPLCDGTHARADFDIRQGDSAAR